MWKIRPMIFITETAGSALQLVRVCGGDVRKRQRSICQCWRGSQNVTSKDAGRSFFRSAHRREGTTRRAPTPQTPLLTTQRISKDFAGFSNVFIMKRGLPLLNFLITFPLISGSPFQYSMFQGNPYSGTETRQRNK